MIYLIWAFSISFLLSIVMVSYRYYELAFDKKIISPEKREKIDNKILTFYRKSIILFNRILVSIKNKFKIIPEILAHKLHDLWQKISNKVDTWFDKIKGKKDLNNRGSVSMYWKSVSENRDINK